MYLEHTSYDGLCGGVDNVVLNNGSKTDALGGVILGDFSPREVPYVRELEERWLPRGSRVPAFDAIVDEVVWTCWKKSG